MAAVAPLGLSYPEPFNWQRPDYSRVLRERAERLRRLRAAPHLLPALRAHYAQHPEEFLQHWAWIAEPRAAGFAATDIPLQLWPRQRALIAWILARWKAGESGLVLKARDSGVSWLTVMLGATLCLFYPGTIVGYGSRKIELIDGGPKALFPKARYFLRHLPAEFLPPGFDLDRASTFMKIQFPNGSALTGEGGEHLGRGDRTSLYFVDEAAFLPDEASVDSALSQTTRCRIDVSTPHGRVGGFAERFHSAKVPRFVFRWSDNPLHTAEWYARQRELLAPHILAQEVDADFSASIEGTLIPAAWVSAAVNAHVRLGIKPSGIKCAGLDVADEGDNRCCLVARRGVLVSRLQSWSGKGSDLCASVVKAFALLDEWRFRDTLLFDSDGLGCAVGAIAGQVNDARRAAQREVIAVEAYRGSASPADPDTEAIPGSDRTNADLFLNQKAQSWFSVRQRFECTWQAVVLGRTVDPDGIISLPADLGELQELLVELSTPTFRTNQAGKLLIDKTPDGAASPDRADALAIAFGAPLGTVEVWSRL